MFYLRISSLGIYVIMLKSVLITFLKVGRIVLYLFWTVQCTVYTFTLEITDHELVFLDRKQLIVF